MGLHPPLMAALDPDDRLLHFALPKNIYHQAKRVFFHPGLEQPSNALFMNDKATLVTSSHSLCVSF